MAEVTWIKGTIDPPQSGEYYVTLEAKQDLVDPETGKVYYKTGDVMIDADFYYAEDRFWEQLGKGNPFWEVVCWAHILLPDIPDGVRERLVEYFGERVQWQNGDTCPNLLSYGGGENKSYQKTVPDVRLLQERVRTHRNR